MVTTLLGLLIPFMVGWKLTRRKGRASPHLKTGIPSFVVCLWHQPLTHSSEDISQLYSFFFPKLLHFSPAKKHRTSVRASSCNSLDFICLFSPWMLSVTSISATLYIRCVSSRLSQYFKERCRFLYDFRINARAFLPLPVHLSNVVFFSLAGIDFSCAFFVLLCW